MVQADTTPIKADRLPGADGKPGGGLKAGIAAERAARWWNERGRGAAWRQFNVEEVGRKVRTGGGKGPMLVTQGDMEPVTPSGILNGHRFEDLTKDEKLSVVKVWYAEVWAPEQRADKPRPIDEQAGKADKTVKRKEIER